MYRKRNCSLKYVFHTPMLGAASLMRRRKIRPRWADFSNNDGTIQDFGPSRSKILCGPSGRLGPTMAYGIHASNYNLSFHTKNGSALRHTRFRLSKKLRRIFCVSKKQSKNTYQDASVEFVRSIRTNSARSRLQKTGGKPRRGFSTRSSTGCKHPVLLLFTWQKGPRFCG